MPPKLYDGHEVTEVLGVSYDDVMTWARRGIIPRIRVGRLVVFNLDRVVEALRSARGGSEGSARTVMAR